MAREEWTEELIREAATGLSSRMELFNSNKPAYLSALRIDGLLDSMFNRVKRTWSTDEVIVEANKYDNKSAFRSRSTSAYNTAVALGMLSDLFPIKAPYWTESRIREMAPRVKTRSEFARAYGAGYAAASKIEGLLDELFPLTPPVRKQVPVKPDSVVWSESKVREYASMFSTRKAFKSAFPGGAGAAYRLHIMDELFPRLIKHWDEQSVRAIAASCQTRVEFLRKHPGAYAAAVRLGIYDGLIPSDITYWTIPRLMEEAKKFPSKSELYRNNNGAHNAALRLGVLDDIFTGCNFSWDSEDKIREVASGISTKTAFLKAYPGAYAAAVRYQILDDLGFQNGRCGYHTDSPAYLYIADIRLKDNTDAVVFGITNRHPTKRYQPGDISKMYDRMGYYFYSGRVALDLETKLKRVFVDNRLLSKQSPLRAKNGLSGEIVVGIQRSIVDLTALHLIRDSGGFDWSESW